MAFDRSRSNNEAKNVGTEQMTEDWISQNEIINIDRYIVNISWNFFEKNTHEFNNIINKNIFQFFAVIYERMDYVNVNVNLKIVTLNRSVARYLLLCEITRQSSNRRGPDQRGMDGFEKCSKPDRGQNCKRSDPQSSVPWSESSITRLCYGLLLFTHVNSPLAGVFIN